MALVAWCEQLGGNCNMNLASLQNRCRKSRVSVCVLVREFSCLQVPAEAFTYLTRIHYSAKSDETWGEHEIDYILFIKRDVTVSANPNEVKSHCYVTEDELRDILRKAEEGRGGVVVTPWFKAIADNFLFRWWREMDSLQQFQDHTHIHRM